MIAQNGRIAAVRGTNCYPCISEKSRPEGHTVLLTFPCARKSLRLTAYSNSLHISLKDRVY